MRKVLLPVSTLLISVFLLILGQGLLNLLLAVRLDAAGASRTVVGGMTSAYYLGLVVGALRLPRTVARTGHIRAFAAFAAGICAAVLLHGLWFHPAVWAALRAINGLCTAGLLLVVESWLGARSTPESRGRLLSVYMLVYYLALGGGQLLLQAVPGAGLEPFALAAILVTIAVIPTALTRHDAPTMEAPAPFGVRALTDRAPLGLVGALASGVVLGAFYGVGPVFAREVGLDLPGTTRLMAFTILGGLVLQWPIGHLSDVLDRRSVLAGVAIAVAPTSALVMLTASTPITMLVACVAFGGLAATLYPLSMAHTSDRVSPGELVDASSALVLVTGAGSVVGPIIAATAMDVIGPAGLFVTTGAVGLLTGGYVVHRIRVKEPSAIQGTYTAIPRTTSMAMELDGRTEELDLESAREAAAAG